MRLVTLIIAFLTCVPVVYAQTTYTAASCNELDVSTAINNEIASAVDGDVITIPACSSGVVWTTGINVTFPKSVTVQGAGAISATTGGASTTGTDQTVLINNINCCGGQGLMTFNTNASKSLRVTGIAFKENSGTTVQVLGNLRIGGKSTAIRVDHCHFEITFGGGKGLFFTGSVTGVSDHLWFHTTQTITNNFQFQNGDSWNGDTGAHGNGSFADIDHFGSSQFMFAEDIRSDGGYPDDCSVGGRFVFRYSTLVNGQGLIGHGTHDEFRGCRAAEVYNVTLSNPSGFQSGGVLDLNSGTQLAWGNTVTNFRNIVNPGYYRITGVPYGTTPAPPNGFGMCGNVTGGPSVWDQNAFTNGYACLDQPSRGAGDLLTNITGNNFSTILDSVTGTRTWPNEALVPIYAWVNTLGGTGATSIFGVQGGLALTNNNDYYQDFSTFGNSGSFNGTAGIGTGSSLPSVAQPTCTPSTNTLAPGTMWMGVSVSGKWGPGYWDTSNNTLYVCTATNTWTVYYTPYTYPHPLTSGGTPQAGIPVCSPAAGGYTVISLSVSCTNPSSTPVECYTLDGTLPVTNGATGCTNGSVLSGSVAITLTIPGITLKVVAGGTGFGDSVPAVNTYTFLPIITTPQSFT